MVPFLSPENPRLGAMAVQENLAVLKIPFRLGSFLLYCYVLRVSLFLFGRETLICFFLVQKILIHLVCNILNFHISVFLLIHWEACISHFLEALASCISRTMLIRVVLLAIADASSVLPPVEGVVIHSDHSEFQPQVKVHRSCV